MAILKAGGILAGLVVLAAFGPSQAATKPPVLLPQDRAVRGAMKVISLPSGYSASGQLGGGTSLEIVGMVSPGRGDQLTIQKTEYGYDASLVRGAGLYNLTLQCSKRDARCANDAYIRKLAAGLKP